MEVRTNAILVVKYVRKLALCENKVTVKRVNRSNQKFYLLWLISKNSLFQNVILAKERFYIYLCVSYNSDLIYFVIYLYDHVYIVREHCKKSFMCFVVQLGIK